MPDQSSAATEHAILQEITAPLETLPDDPLSIVDADFPTSLRGYDRVSVDEYVAQTRQLVAELQATRSPEAAVRRALERVGEQISGILQRAHETAEQITAQSRSEAEERLQHARLEAEQVADAAEQRVRELDGDTDRIWLERQRIVADAEDLAGQLLALARVAAERFPTDDDAEAAGDGLAPEEEASLVAGIPVEAGAPEGEAGPESEVEAGAPEDEPGALEDEPGALEGEPGALEDDARAEDDAGIPSPDDIERTVAFSPLQFSGEEVAEADEPPTAEEPPNADELPPDADAPQARSGRPADEESTSVIRPASQAANRRLGR